MDKPLTDKQKLFCDYKMEGLSNHDAAVKAGYRATNQNNAGLVPIRSIAVQRELAIRSDYELLTIAPMVIQTLIKLLHSSKDEVRLSAARDLADRIGLGEHAKNSQQNLQVNINLGNDSNTLLITQPPPFPGRKVP